MVRLLRRSLLVFVLAMLIPALAESQERPPADTTGSPDAEGAMAEQARQMRGMMPMMTEMMRQVTRSSMEALAEPSTAQNLARFTRNYYEALVEQGFSEAQAMQIVSNLGFPPTPSM